MAIYGTPEQCEKYPDFYEPLPEGYIIELFNKVIEMINKKHNLETKIYLN
jgi:hypothetical protein